VENGGVLTRLAVTALCQRVLTFTRYGRLEIIINKAIAPYVNTDEDLWRSSEILRMKHTNYEMMGKPTVVVGDRS